MPRYTVERGDTLSAIARQNGITLQELLRVNPDLRANPNRIQIGQRVRLPKGSGGSNDSSESTETGASRPEPGTGYQRRPNDAYRNVEVERDGEQVPFDEAYGGSDQDIWTDDRERIGRNYGKITFRQVARSLGMSPQELLDLNPALEAAHGGNIPSGNVWGMDINTGQGSFFNDNGRVRKRFAPGLDNARLDYATWLDRRAEEHGYEFDGDRPGPDTDPTFEDDPDTEWNEERIQEALNQDPAYLAMMSGLDLQAADVEAARIGDNARLQAQFDRYLPQLQHQLRQQTRQTDFDFSGRGLYFGSGRDRDLNILRGENARTENDARMRMIEGQQARDRDAARAITDIEAQRAQGTVAASERVTQRRLEDEYPEVT